MTNTVVPTKRPPSSKPGPPIASARPSVRPPLAPENAPAPSHQADTAPTFERLVDRSLSAALSAIEVYNKPSFAYREEAFTVLIVNAWELLIKAKLLKAADNKIEAILAVKDGKPKYSRSAGVPLTIDILNAMLKAGLPERVSENIKALVEIRDAAVHLCCERDEAFSYLVFTLAAASLRNYARLMHEWFDKSLKDYNFFVLPLAFAYNFQTLGAVELDRRPSAIRTMIEAVTRTQSSLSGPDDHSFVCEIRTEIRAAPKFADGADYTTAVDPKAGPGSTGHVRLQRLIDRYPLTYTELLTRIRRVLPNIKQAQVDAVLKAKVKGDAKLSAYNFRSKAQERRYADSGTKKPTHVPVIYNEDAIRLVLAELGS